MSTPGGNVCDVLTPDEWVAKALAEAPPLTEQQRTKLAELQRPVREMVADLQTLLTNEVTA